MATLIGLTIAVAAAACGRNEASVTSPSGAAPVNLNVGPGTPVREYTAGISPTPTSTGTREFTVTITNSNTSTVSNGILLRAAGITVPAGVTGVTINSVVAVGGAKSWGGHLDAGVIIVGASTGNAGLAPTESVVVKFNATIADCGTYPFNTVAYQDALDSVTGALVTTTPFALIGNQPQVVVDSGCSVGDCPDADAIANAYLKAHGLPANDSLHATIIQDIAHVKHDLFGDDPCAEGYADAVTAYIHDHYGI